MTEPERDVSTRCVIDGRRLRQDGALTCGGCLAALDALLDPLNAGAADGLLGQHLPSIPVLYALLDPRPQRGAGGRGAPGFESTIPISAHVASMRDRRSKANRPNPDDPAESLRPPLHPSNVLEGWARVLAEERGVDRPRIPDTRPGRGDYIGPQTWREDDVATSPLPRDTAVPVLAAFLRRHLDWTSRQLWVDDFATELQELRVQLRAATGDPRPRPIGRCPNTVDDGDSSRECTAPLRVATYSDTVRCPACGRTWPRAEWLRLGALLTEEATT